MGTFNDTARPRFYALDADYRIEVDYVAANAATGIPAHVAPLDVVDYDGHEASNEDVFALASSLRGYDGDDVDAFAIELDALQRQSLTGRVLRALDRAAGGSR